MLQLPPLRIFSGNPEDSLKQKVKLWSRELEDVLQHCYLMVLVANENKAIGLAAPQISVWDRLFIFWNFGDHRFDFAYDPQLEIQDFAQEVALEGCLSIPGKQILVPRYKKTKLIYTCPRTGKKFEREDTGLQSRVIQHEYDHLEGKLITNYENSNFNSS